jgi:hypothetical protein
VSAAYFALIPLPEIAIMALQRKKREGKKTIPVSQAHKTRSGAKKHKSDGRQAPAIKTAAAGIATPSAK